MTIEEIDALKSVREHHLRGTDPMPAPPARKGLPEGYGPSEAELRKYLGEWDGLDDYVDQEKALAMLSAGIRHLPPTPTCGT